MRPSLFAVFVIAVATGIGAGWWLSPLEAPSPRPGSEAAPAATGPADQGSQSGGGPAGRPPPQADILSRLDALRSRAAPEERSTAGGIATARPADVESARRIAERAAADETLERARVRELLEAHFAGRVPEAELAHVDYEAMTDAVMRIRAARRALGALEPSAASAEVLADARQDLTDALADFQLASGVAPSDLTELFDPADGLSHDDPADQGGPSGDDADDAAPEYLRDYPPPH
jgi:hypothetical protein